MHKALQITLGGLMGLAGGTLLAVVTTAIHRAAVRADASNHASREK